MAACMVLSSSALGERCFINVMGTNLSVSADEWLRRKETIAEVRVRTRAYYRTIPVFSQSRHVHIGGYFNCAGMQTEALITLVRRLSS